MPNNKKGHAFLVKFKLSKDNFYFLSKEEIISVIKMDNFYTFAQNIIEN